MLLKICSRKQWCQPFDRIGFNICFLFKQAILTSNYSRKVSQVLWPSYSIIFGYLQWASVKVLSKFVQCLVTKVFMSFVSPKQVGCRLSGKILQQSSWHPFRPEVYHISIWSAQVNVWLFNSNVNFDFHEHTLTYIFFSLL